MWKSFSNGLKRLNIGKQIVQLALSLFKTPQFYLHFIDSKIWRVHLRICDEKLMWGLMITKGNKQRAELTLSSRPCLQKIIYSVRYRLRYFRQVPFPLAPLSPGEEISLNSLTFPWPLGTDLFHELCCPICFGHHLTSDVK